MRCHGIGITGITGTTSEDMVILAEAVARDKDYLFKFHVGDKVKKRWIWAKGIYNRYYREHLNLSKLKEGGIIEGIDEDGTICIFSKCRQSHWHFGASELDLLPADEEE